MKHTNYRSLHKRTVSHKTAFFAAAGALLITGGFWLSGLGIGSLLEAQSGEHFTTLSAWQNYMSYSRDAVPAWARTVRRHGKTSEELAALLQVSDVIHQVNGGLRSGEDPLQVQAFMESMETDPEVWKESVEADVAATAGYSRSVFWQVGNEINTLAYSATMRPWATNPPLSPSRNDTSYIPALVEYFLAPAAEAIRRAEAKTGQEIPLLIGSVIVAGAPKTNPWLTTLLNTRIVGTYAPSLAGKYVRDVYDYVDHHYTLNTPDWEGGLTAMEGWIGTGTIRGAFDSEEIGNKAMELKLGAERALTAFGRFIYFAAREGLTSEQTRLNIWSEGDEEAGAALQIVHDFIGVGTLTTVAPVSAEASLPVEVRGFERLGRRMVIITAPADSSVTVTSLQVPWGSGKWKGATVQGRVHSFTSGTPDYGVKAVKGTHAKTDAFYTVPLNLTLTPEGVALVELTGTYR